MNYAKSDEDKELTNRLCIEFQDELDNLGVRIRELEKHRSAVKWTGRLSYTYSRNGREGREDSEREPFAIRLEPIATLNDHWNARARLDATTNMLRDFMGRVSLKRVFVEGKYGDTVLRLGRVPLSTNENGIVLSGSFSGLTVKTGKKWEPLFLAGRLNMSKTGAYQAGLGYARNLQALGFKQEASVVRSMASDPADILGVNLQYKAKQGFFGGVGFYFLRSQAYNFIDDAEGGEGDVNIASVNVGYQFSPKLALKGAYAKADYARHSDKDLVIGNVQDYSWGMKIDYGDYNRARKKGMWEAYLAYNDYGYVSSVMPSSSTIGEMFDNDRGIANWGERGFEVGGTWAPEKNVGIVVSYSFGKSLTTNRHMDSLLTRLEMFF